MWYPTVRRTLVCLSRLYRCVERPIFQGLSQEALSMCMQSVTAAADAISLRKVRQNNFLLLVLLFHKEVYMYTLIYLFYLTDCYGWGTF